MPRLAFVGMGKRAFRKSNISKVIAHIKVGDLGGAPNVTGGLNRLRRVEVKDSERHEIWDLLRRLTILPGQTAAAARAEIALPIFGRCKTRSISARDAEILHRCISPSADQSATKSTQIEQ